MSEIEDVVGEPTEAGPSNYGTTLIVITAAIIAAIVLGVIFT